ncbi:type II secretion system protein [Parasalinivibrio latis]|uniref:type II secretion system protein n=1 Tax=Parasalinivibrio latis TaxID=2952610 RepID=UPI0030E5D6EE
MRKQGGFTLIELVVVIVILGILAVTAAPKFLNFQDDAKKASLQGLKGAIDGAASIVYGKAAVDSVTDGNVDGIVVVNGYPAATSAGIGAAVIGLNEDWTEVSSNTTAGSKSVTYSFKGTAANTSTCIVTYLEATGSNAASAAKTTIKFGTGCE